jgi:hypothetical protein
VNSTHVDNTAASWLLLLVRVLAAKAATTGPLEWLVDIRLYGVGP